MPALGQELIACQSQADEDLALLEEVLIAYAGVRNKSRLSSVEDLAGVRIVADITLSEQNALAARVCELFGGPDGCRLIDRRADPRAGYRAVHVIARLNGMPMEIQVRTRCQDAWANLYVAWIVEMSDSIYAQEREIDQLPGDDRPSLSVLWDGLARLTSAMRELKGRLRHLTEAGS